MGALFILPLPLLEGEPAAGAAVSGDLPASAATPAAATDTPDTGQQADSTPASTTVQTDASDTPASEDGTPAETPDDAPADDVPDLSAEDFAELSDDDKSLFIEAYGEDLLKTEAGQKLVLSEAQRTRDREATEQAQQPDADPVYKAMAGQVADHLEKLSKIVDVEDPSEIDTDELTANTALLHEWTEATTHRQNFQHANAALNEIANEVFGSIDPAKPPSDPAWLEANDAWKAAFQAYGEAGVQVDRARKSQNPKTRASAPQQEAKRHADFIKTTVRIALEIGKAAGSTARAKSDAPKVAARVRLAQSNGIRQALAKSAARNGNATGAEQASKQVTATKKHSWDEIQRMTPAQINALPQGEWDRAMNEG